jgi:hypothetical protein
VGEGEEEMVAVVVGLGRGEGASRGQGAARLAGYPAGVVRARRREVREGAPDGWAPRVNERGRWWARG